MGKEDPVVALGAELRGIAAERTRLAEEHLKCQLAGGSLRDVDDGFAVLSEKWHPAMRRLADTPAETTDGVLLKLRTVAAALASGQTSAYDEDILLLAIADLDRLSRS
jgi:hypothetical protein